jgi:hypothetical protein
MTPDAAKTASYRNDTRGYELRQVIRGYLVDPQSLKDHEPTWAEILATATDKPSSQTPPARRSRESNASRHGRVEVTPLDQ